MTGFGLGGPLVPAQEPVPAVPLPEQQPQQQDQGAPQALHSAILQTESGGMDYDANGKPVVSPTGAMYAYQVMPSTAQKPGFGIEPVRDNSPSEYNRVGAAYLDKMMSRYNGNAAMAAAAYNAGPDAVDKAVAAAARTNDPNSWVKMLPQETQQYVYKVGVATGNVDPSVAAPPGQPKPPTFIPWEQVAEKPEYQTLSSPDKQALKQDYFNNVVAPHFDPTQLPGAYKAFMDMNQDPGFFSTMLFGDKNTDGLLDVLKAGARGAAQIPAQLAQAAILTAGAIPAVIDSISDGDGAMATYADLTGGAYKKAQAMINYWDDPKNASLLSKIVHGVANVGFQFAAGGAKLPIATSIYHDASELMDKGVSPATAAIVAMAQSSLYLIPGFKVGPEATTTLGKIASESGNAALQGGMFAGTGSLADEVSKVILEANGYDKQAKDYNPLDPTTAAVRAATGAAIHLSAPVAEKLDQTLLKAGGKIGAGLDSIEQNVTGKVRTGANSKPQAAQPPGQETPPTVPPIVPSTGQGGFPDDAPVVPPALGGGEEDPIDPFGAPDQITPEKSEAEKQEREGFLKNFTNFVKSAVEQTANGARIIRPGNLVSLITGSKDRGGQAERLATQAAYTAALEAVKEPPRAGHDGLVIMNFGEPGLGKSGIIDAAVADQSKAMSDADIITDGLHANPAGTVDLIREALKAGRPVAVNFLRPVDHTGERLALAVAEGRQFPKVADVLSQRELIARTMEAVRKAFDGNPAIRIAEYPAGSNIGRDPEARMNAVQSETHDQIIDKAKEALPSKLGGSNNATVTQPVSPEGAGPAQPAEPGGTVGAVLGERGGEPGRVDAGSGDGGGAGRGGRGGGSGEEPGGPGTGVAQGENPKVEEPKGNTVSLKVEPKNLPEERPEPKTELKPEESSEPEAGPDEKPKPESKAEQEARLAEENTNKEVAPVKKELAAIKKRSSLSRFLKKLLGNVPISHFPGYGDVRKATPAEATRFALALANIVKSGLPESIIRHAVNSIGVLSDPASKKHAFYVTAYHDDNGKATNQVRQITVHPLLHELATGSGHPFESIFAHELWHAIDHKLGDWRNHTADEGNRFEVEGTGSELIPHGDVAEEVFNFYGRNPRTENEAVIHNILDYPMADVMYDGKASPAHGRVAAKEIAAQVFRAYYENPGALKEALPKAYEVMDGLHDKLAEIEPEADHDEAARAIDEAVQAAIRPLPKRVGRGYVQGKEQSGSDSGNDQGGPENREAGSGLERNGSLVGHGSGREGTGKVDEESVSEAKVKKQSAPVAPKEPNRGEEEYGDEISTRLPTAVKATEDPVGEMLKADYPSLLKNPDLHESMLHRMAKYIGMPKMRSNISIDRMADTIINHLKDNLVHLYKAFKGSAGDDVIARASQWYRGGRKISERLAERWGVPVRTVAGMIAVTSPSMDWYKNVSMAERIGDILKNQQNTPWTDAMSREFERLIEGAKEEDQKRVLSELYEKINGKSLGELTTAQQKAGWIRAFDYAKHIQNYRIVSPEGDFLGWQTNKNGAPSKHMHQSIGNIAKAVRIFENPSRENISNELGEGHKVRSFYNNLVNPDSAHDHITIDTHEVAAALLRPLGNAAYEVNNNFGSGKPAKPNAGHTWYARHALSTPDFGSVQARSLFLPRAT